MKKPPQGAAPDFIITGDETPEERHALDEAIARHKLFFGRVLVQVAPAKPEKYYASAVGSDGIYREIEISKELHDEMIAKGAKKVPDQIPACLIPIEEKH